MEQIATAQFLRADIQPLLEPGEIELLITGRLSDGTRFEGTDTIRAIYPCHECPSWPLGDIDGNGYINGSDVILIAEKFNQPACDAPCADLNGDGWINGNDLIPIANNFGKGDGTPCPL